MERTKKPTMKDVASEAGVALGTVSKVFNGIAVGDEYRKKVEEAATKLGYEINNYARAMRTNRTNTVAVILPELIHPYFAKLADELCRKLNSYNYRTLIAVTDRDMETEEKCISMVKQQKCDGIIALTYNPAIEEFNDIPFVCIDRSYGGAVPCITSDNFAGGQIAAAKLKELGCKSLIYLRAGSSIPGETDKRGVGFEVYCRQNKMKYNLLISNDETIEEGVISKLNQFINKGKFKYDGIFCSNDLLASNVRIFLEKQGIKVPEDVQIIGFDGLKSIWNNEYICSSIVQPVEEIASTAINTLFSINENTQATVTCLPVSYVAGPTTKDYYGK